MITVNLTEIEHELLFLLTEGKSSEEIAEVLNRSVKTIDHQIFELRKKTGHDSRVSLIVDYLRGNDPDTLLEEIKFLDAKILEIESKISTYRTIKEVKLRHWQKQTQILGNNDD